MADPSPLERLGFYLASLPVRAELARWRRAGVRPLLWWRDDDVRVPSAALDQLLALADGRPIGLAVIPDGDLTALAARLKGARHVSVGQHGVDHTNRRPSGQTPSEYADPADVAGIVKRLASGLKQLQAAGLKPVFYTPPWNAVDPGLGKAVSRAGIPILSAGATALVYADLRYLPAEIDVLRWKGGPRFKGRVKLMSALRQALAQRRRAREFGQPIGLLTHHLDHDVAAWRFLDQSMGFFDRRFAWVDVEGRAYPRTPPVGDGSAVRPMAQAMGV